MIGKLLNVQQNGRGTDLSAALQFTRNVLKQRSVCFVLSDFIAPVYEAPLRVLAKRHDCIGIHCWDARERDLPDVGLLRVRDAETGQETWVDTTDPDLRRDYHKRFDQHRADAQSLFRRAGADFLSVETVESYTQVLLRFFEMREK